MPTRWNEAKIRRYIKDLIEESLVLDYKAADSLAKSDGKKTEITKDVSAMANSAGGIIIYGVKEYQEKDKKHLPEKIDPVDRTQFSKEWLEQVINNIQPHIYGVLIHPVRLSTGPNDVAYVVEIPQSHTAHQATNYRYYKRYNFESQPMADYEVRDVMNRATVPDADVEFRFRSMGTSGRNNEYLLQPVIKNLGTQMINNFRLKFVFPRAGYGRSNVHPRENVVRTVDNDNNSVINYQSRGVLFPLEERPIGEEIEWRYRMDAARAKELQRLEKDGEPVLISWTLFADNMVPKQGIAPFTYLHDFELSK
jgi:hypothetical protein